MPKILTRDALAARIAELPTGAELRDFAMRSSRAEWTRAAPTDEDKARVRQVLGEDAAAARIVPFTISTERRADDGLVLKMAGGLVERYQKNPIVAWQHNTWRERIADAVVWVEGDRMRALAAFMSRELSEVLDDGFSWAVGELAALRGHAASIGFEVLAATPAPEEIRKVIPWALDVHSWQLFEWSLVTLPADEDALDEGRAAGLDMEPLARGFARMLDSLEAGGIERAQIERAWAAARGARTTVVVDKPPPSPSAEELLAAVRQGWLPQLPRG
jgi:hypothetical protein